MRTIDDLVTPCLLIEKKRLEANISAMQARANRAEVSLRPHIKPHKMLALARMQRAAGARGITVAKIGEAEVFAKEGFDDIRVAYTVVGRDKLERIAVLGDRVSFCVDTLEAARQASEFFASYGHVASVLLEIDAGYGRCGVRWDDPNLAMFASDVARLPGLTLTGILTHEGDAYKPNYARKAMETARDRMLSVAVRLARADLAAPGSFEISVGSTPSAYHFENATRGGFKITEIRPGNYVFNDMTQVNLGVCNLKDCALTALATVISRRRAADGTERFFLDAGRKVLTSDRAPLSDEYGQLLYHARNMVPHPHARLVGLSEEHGWGAVHGGGTLSVGDRVRVVPNHACVVVNTQDEVYLLDNDIIIDQWLVDARGRVR